MKKISGVIITVCMILALAGCASNRAAGPGLPPEIQRALNNVPEDVLYGLGDGFLNTVSQSRTQAAARARAEISRTMNTMVDDMIRDYQASSEVDRAAALSFQENITVSLSRSTLNGSQIVAQAQDSDGRWWAVVYLSKADVAREITMAASQAQQRLAIPAMASFDAEARMNEAFERAVSEGRM